jgi:hypothetical protein
MIFEKVNEASLKAQSFWRRFFLRILTGATRDERLESRRRTTVDDGTTTSRTRFASSSRAVQSRCKELTQLSNLKDDRCISYIKAWPLKRKMNWSYPSLFSTHETEASTI